MNRETKKTIWRIAVVVAAAVLLCVTVPALKSFQTVQAKNTAPEKSGRIYLGTEGIERDGVYYTLRSDIETYLLLGIDTDGERTEGYDLGGQADVLLLLVMDNAHDSYRILQINRDTMTQVTTLSSGGAVAGESFFPICLSHAYGSGGKDSCENTVRAVQYLLSDITIDGYAAIDMESIGRLNDAVGGVTLTIGDDLTAANPAFTKGAVVRLDAGSAEDFLRARMSLGESNNINRMARHRQYMDAWIAAAREKTHGDSAEFAAFVDEIKGWLVTDITDKRLAAIAEDAYRYENGGYITITGENDSSGSYNRFYADEDSITEALLTLFYEKQT